MGKWKLREDRRANGEIGSVVEHSIRLPFRTQPEPDYRSRSREKSIMMDLLAQKIGRGYCHSWYARRFLSPVKVSEVANPHSGLGLECYVQWTSPLRRFCDLQVHCAVKRYLRRRKVNDIITKGGGIPSGVTPADLGCDVPFLNSTLATVYNDIDYRDRAGKLGAARTLQRQSQQYWLLEYIRRRKDTNQSVTYDAVVLGCVDPERRQYSVYIYELGFEWKYSTPVGSLGAGTSLRLKVTSVSPRSGLLTLTRADM
jgi:exoribonuclease R